MHCHFEGRFPMVVWLYLSSSNFPVSSIPFMFRHVKCHYQQLWMLHALKQAHRITSPSNLLSLPSKGRHITGNWHHACISILLFLVSLQTSSYLQIAMASCLELPTQSYTACQCIRYPCTCSNRLSCFFIGLKYAISMLLWLYVSILFFEMDVQCRSFSHTYPCTQ